MNNYFHINAHPAGPLSLGIPHDGHVNCKHVNEHCNVMRMGPPDTQRAEKMQRCKQVRAASCASVFDGSSKCSLLAKSRARAPRAAAAGAQTAARAADAAHMNATLDTSGPSGAGPASRTALARLSIPGCIVRRLWRTTLLLLLSYKVQYKVQGAGKVPVELLRTVTRGYLKAGGYRADPQSNKKNRVRAQACSGPLDVPCTVIASLTPILVGGPGRGELGARA